MGIFKLVYNKSKDEYFCPFDINDPYELIRFSKFLNKIGYKDTEELDNVFSIKSNIRFTGISISMKYKTYFGYTCHPTGKGHGNRIPEYIKETLIWQNSIKI